MSVNPLIGQTMRSNISGKVCFMVPRMHKKADQFPGVVEIIPVLVIGSVKGSWRCELTSADKGVRRSFNKNNFILYDNTLGARSSESVYPESDLAAGERSRYLV